MDYDMEKLRQIFVLLILGSIVMVGVYIKSTPPATRIERIIKTHNSVKETNSQFPVNRKSPSSQETLFGQDSIRVAHEIYDNDTNIIYWEMQNDTLHIYTKEDSARDASERIKYIHSIEPFPGKYDSLIENCHD
jgi:hypothetical protein